MAERDPRKQPRIGDVLKTSTTMRMVQSTVLQRGDGTAVIRIAEVPRNPNREWISVAMWKRWAEHAKVIHRADPTLCTLCLHLSHRGRQCSVIVERPGEYPQTCDCPGPSEIERGNMSSCNNCGKPYFPGHQCPPTTTQASESAERPDGWYWVKLRDWTPEPARWVGVVSSFSVAGGGFKESELEWIGPRIPSPDEPRCPISAQELRDAAAMIDPTNKLIYATPAWQLAARKLRTLADFLEGKQ